MNGRLRERPGGLSGRKEGRYFVYMEVISTELSGLRKFQLYDSSATWSNLSDHHLSRNIPTRLRVLSAKARAVRGPLILQLQRSRMSRPDLLTLECGLLDSCVGSSNSLSLGILIWLLDSRFEGPKG